MAASPLEIRVRQARRRLFGQVLLNRIGLAWGCALAIGLLWILAGPFIVPNQPEYLKWVVLGTSAGLGTTIAPWSAVRSSPPPLPPALPADERFNPQKRGTPPSSPD